MSYIYEALQRAEAERSGGNAPKDAESVADLLQGLEKEAGAKHPQGNLAAAVKPPLPGAVAFAAAKMLAPALGAESRLVCLSDQGSMAAEKFRVLGLKLRHLKEQRQLKRIVITSSIPEEGKSLVAANLALNQSRSKILSTVLIDGDLRRPELARRFGFDRSLPGLSEVLRGERQLEEVVYKLERTGLRFIPAGVTPENPIEMMQSGRLQQILEQLDAAFDWVIIDTPPVAPLADTPIWMKLSDGVLLVAREGVCEKKQLVKAIAALDPPRVLGVVVNSCSSNDQKYYYSRYGTPPGGDGPVAGES
jgi:capsular exopolysaccharide synthesis family protein